MKRRWVLEQKVECSQKWKTDSLANGLKPVQNYLSERENEIPIESYNSHRLSIGLSIGDDDRKREFNLRLIKLNNY